MIIQKIWASLIGVVLFTIGMLGIFSIVNIPMRDAVIHMITGALFLTGSWIRGGSYSASFNIILGVFYIIFGLMGHNWPHTIAGIVSCIIGLWLKRDLIKPR